MRHAKLAFKLWHAFMYITDKYSDYVFSSITTKIEWILIISSSFRCRYNRQWSYNLGLQNKSMPHHRGPILLCSLFFRWSAMLSWQWRKAEVTMMWFGRSGSVKAWCTGLAFNHANSTLLSHSTKNLIGICLTLIRDISVRPSFALFIRGTDLPKMCGSGILHSDTLLYIEQECQSVSYLKYFIDPQISWGFSSNFSWHLSTCCGTCYLSSYISYLPHSPSFVGHWAPDRLKLLDYISVQCFHVLFSTNILICWGTWEIASRWKDVPSQCWIIIRMQDQPLDPKWMGKNNDNPPWSWWDRIQPISEPRQ